MTLATECIVSACIGVLVVVLYYIISRSIEKHKQKRK